MSAPADLFAGGGEMGAIMRSTDWSKTKLGPVEQWPRSLRTMLGVVLGSRFPMLLWWGPDLLHLYNDAYRPILRDKHPASLAAPAAQVWAEVWDVAGPMARSVQEGGPATWTEDLQLFINSGGMAEETYFTFSYSPVPGDDGRVGGLLNTVQETTAKVQSERQIRMLHDLSARAADAQVEDEAYRIAVEVLSANELDLPFVLFYLLNEKADDARLVGGSGWKDYEGPARPAHVPIGGDASAAHWPLAEVMRTGRELVIDDLSGRFGPLPIGRWNARPERAIVLPLSHAGQSTPSAFLLAGISPHRPFDDRYQRFFRATADQVMTIIANARASEAEKKRSDALAEIDRDKTAFFSNVSHEFRTPLTLMLGPTEDALSSPGQALSGEALRMVHRNTLRLMRLVNSILDFSRVESGRAQASYEPSDLATITTYLASAFRSAVERNGLTFEVDCQSLPEPVYVDHDMWEKIVLNLLSNALKFTFEGSVGVSVRWRGDHADLEVRDTGTGIPEKELPRLFERFHRVHGARSRTHEGSGIGLALVHDLVRLHGGNVQAASRPGEGTTFTVSIPCGSAHLPPERIVPKRSTAWTAKGAKPFVEEALRWSAGSRLDAVGLSAAAPTPGTAAAAVPILVVDDNADLRDYIVNLLGQHYAVETAVDGLAALEAARLRKPALVLSDVMMPRLDGFGLLRALRADPVLRDVPVILLSARAGEESTIEGLEAGADDYLVKPFAARELLARVRTHVAFSLMRQRLLLHEAAPDPLVIVDPVGCISVVNGQTERVFGYPRADLIGKPVDMLIPNRFRDRLLGYRMEFAAGHQIRPMASVLDLYGQRSDGSEFPIEISLSPVQTHEGLVVSTTIRDVTERKRLEEVNRQAFELETQNRRIREASRLKSEFLANMSHELRTPLNSILGFGEMLYDGVVPPDSPQHQEFLGDIIKSGRHLLQLINDVLDLAKVEAGKLEFRPEAIDLESVIAEVQSIVRAISVAKNVRIDASIDPVLKQGILLDPARLKQVLYNFISNALKFTPAGGAVTVRARPDGEESLLLEVEDTGSGIAPEDLDRLFVEFQQLEAGTAKRHSGTGLGLALTRRLAEAQGGSVGVRSTLGKGSVFHVVLPRRRPAAAAQPQFQPRPAAPDAPWVLVIEDDARDQAQLVEALSAAGYAVEAASTGSQALALCSARKFDAICLDLLLPDMSGQEILQRVRGGGPNRDVPVVVVTVVAERGAVAGFTVQGFLPKPIDSDALLSSLARAGIRPDQSGSVLVVDDDEASLRLMAAALTQLGFRTVGMQSGEEALRAAGNAPPAAIVLDLLMPGLDGFEFLHRLRDSPATRHTPVLIWSVKDLSTHEQARLSRSVQAILRKGHGGIPALLDDLRRFLPAGRMR